MWKPKKVFARALDPVHIGAGGYKLGWVDNTIVRDPATNVPKIPGTSIAGVVKAFAEIVKEEDEEKNESKRVLKDLDIKELFGTDSKKGALRFYDGQIIFFPVSSIQGTVWVTTSELLNYWLEEDWTNEFPDKLEDKVIPLCGIDPTKPLNLGWLLLKVESSDQEILLPFGVKRAVVVSDKLFPHIVNDNLEVRTSVRIDRDTGTAVEGALFTYEAIPRGAILGFEVCLDRMRNSFSEDTINKLIKAVEPYFRNLGIGGMGTRGFGRLEVLLENDGSGSTGGVTDAQS